MITSDPDLLDDVVRVAAVAGVEVEVAPEVGSARQAWVCAPLVLVGDDAAATVARMLPRRRPGVVVVGRDLDDASVWERAVGVGAEHVALLPDAEPWLVARLGDAVAGSARQGRLVAVVGGRGGAGASSLAAALAVTGMRQRRHTLFVDADPLGGGADLLFGGEDAAGVRWPDLASSRGQIAGHALCEALPSVGELAVLSWDRGEPRDVAADVMTSVIDAAQRSCELVVVDLPRRFDETGELLLARSDLALLIVPAEVRATAAAVRVAAAMTRAAGDVRVVVRGPAPGGLEVGDVVAALRLPLAGSLDPELDLAAALERGEAPAGRGVGPLAEFCARLLGQLFPTQTATDYGGGRAADADRADRSAYRADRSGGASPSRLAAPGWVPGRSA